MATTLEETAVSYEQLSDLEREFDEVETEISEFNGVNCAQSRCPQSPQRQFLH